MRVRIFCLALGALLSALSFPVMAQQAKKVPRIGYLAGISPSADSQRIEVFRQRLRDLGHAEGQNIAIEYRYAEGKFDRLPGFAADLVRLKVDVLVASRRTLPSPRAMLPGRSPSFF
jgi:putative ABC transport system substrate-binding protein